MADPIDADAVRRMLEIGYLAAGNGCFAEAESIFAGVAAVRPESTAPAIGRAVAALNRGAPAEAVRLLEAERGRQPQDELVQAFLGLALRQSGRNAEAAATLGPLAAGADPLAAEMARQLLTPVAGA